MAKVIDMFDPDKRSTSYISDDFFIAKIQSPETTETTQASIGRLIRTPSFKLPAIDSRIVQPSEEPGLQGTCFTLTPRGSNITMLVTSSRFPNFLVSQGLEVEKATEVAAVYARSLDFMHTVLSGKKTWHGGENRAVKRIQQLPGRPEIWHPQFDQTFLKVEFSAAGTVALEATGVTLTAEGPHPLSPHIAGLLDPVKPSFTPGVKTDSTFLGLQEIITHTTR